MEGSIKVNISGGQHKDPATPATSSGVPNNTVSSVRAASMEASSNVSNSGEHHQTEPVTPSSSSDDASNEAVTYEVGQFVSAVYDHKWYIGKISEVDETESEVEISFMEKKKQFFQWPIRPDTIWINTDDILCVLDALVATGKSKRMFKLSENDECLILASFDIKMQKC